MKKIISILLAIFLISNTLQAERIRKKKPRVETELTARLNLIKNQMQAMVNTMEEQLSSTLPVAITKLPYTISQAGKYYIPNNLTFTGNGPAITIASNNVSLDFYNNALILANPAAWGISITNAMECTITNGIIQGPNIGLAIQNSSGIHIASSFFNNSKVTCQNSHSIIFDTVSFESDGKNKNPALLVWNGSEHMTITHCTFSNWQNSIQATDLSGLQIVNSFIQGPGNLLNVGATNVQIQNTSFIDGVVLFANDSGALLEQVLFDCEVDINGYDNILARNSLVTGGSDFGLHIINGSNISCIDCQFSEALTANVQLEKASGCLFSGCKIIDSELDGIVFTQDASQNAVINCELSSNRQDGVRVELGATDNQFQSNNVFDNGNFGINILDPTTACYYNVSCNNKGADCPGSYIDPEQAPGVSNLVPGSNICCIP